ncbi:MULTISPECIES: P1 family peptidase [unclassified Microbacterium]|uniref:P1 family peptidase n=1 Tax=unclassified Microbacterium TaxID=2609290 RepID=UPI00097E776D|nr:P1 family peptidase [Microbacterium sp. JB110]SJM49115.1 possible hydrolase [Frigoribacterium sp. JB110]
MTHRLAPYFPSSAGRTNRDLPLVPANGAGRSRLEYDFPGVLVGSAEYDEGPTGATVISVPAGARTAVDARGGAVGQIGSYPFNHAICLAGGSVYGLAAATGVSHALLESTEGRASFADLKLVSGAIIYDLAVRDNAIYPDTELGRAALENAEPAVRIGRVGAGATASAGKIEYSRTEFTGQGAAFRQVGDVKVLAVTVVNPVGVVVDRDGTIIRGDYDESSGERHHPDKHYEAAIAEGGLPDTAAGNTTVTAVITNVALGDVELNQLAKQVHSSMHRGIQPFHTSLDGDTLFALTTDEVELPRSPETKHGRLSLNATAIGSLASDVVWDAIVEAGR